MRISDWSSDVCSSDLSLTSYNDFQRKALSDWSGAPYEILLQKADGRIKSFAQEIHFEGERSEEHTSELQSLMRTSYAVFCLKKKTPQPSKPSLHSFRPPSP